MMKAPSFGKWRGLPRALARGSSTLEILIALAILTLALTAVILVFSSNQSLTVDTQAAEEALGFSQAQLEVARAAARQDFNLVNPATTTRSSGGLTSTTTLTVAQVDLFTKQATSTTSWTEGARPLSVILSTILTNPAAVHGGSTCSSILSGDWTRPKILNTVQIDFTPNQLTGTAVFNGIAYLTGFHTGSKPDLMLVNVSNPISPVTLSTLDTGPGLAAVTVASTSGETYAFAANRSTAGQLQVIQVTNPAAPVLATTTRVAGAGGVGNTVFYSNNRLYLGLTAHGSGPQLVIFDVSSSTNPIQKGSYTLGHDVNAIQVRGAYAYVATPDTEELKVFDISNPASPTLVGGSGVLPDSTANGESVSIVGNSAYLGRSVGLSGTTKQLYQFDVTNPATDPLPIIGAPLAVASSVTGVMVRSNLLFMTTSAQFQVRALSAPNALSGSVDIFGLGGSPPGALSCEGNLFYLGVLGDAGGSGHNVLQIIGPS